MYPSDPWTLQMGNAPSRALAMHSICMGHTPNLFDQWPGPASDLAPIQAKNQVERPCAKPCTGRVPGLPSHAFGQCWTLCLRHEPLT
ncbi:hypothetical protein NL676_034792 [Syzygium grande]|nr:hypothetical protein NL676_034792 [Syzygium grande]